VSQPIRNIAEAAKRASRLLGTLTAEHRNVAILSAADLIEQSRSRLLQAHAEDMDAASALLARGEMSSATFERLRLNDKKIAEMRRSMLAVANLPDPVGRILQRTELDRGLMLDKVTCPLGVLAVIFEARPDAVTQISALGLKSANAVILKAGREVERTASALVEIIRQALDGAGLPPDAINLVTGREAVADLHPNMFWSSGRKILEAARLASTRPNLHMVYITNFKCGPDSYIKHFARETAGAPLLVLQFDGHGNDAGYMTRCEAYLDSKGILRCYQQQPVIH